MEHLAPGTRLQHTGGATVTLARRKTDDSGWWNTDGTGLSDHVIDHYGEWTVASHPPVDYPALCRQLGEALELWGAGGCQTHEQAQIDAALTAWRAAAAPRESNIGLGVAGAGTRLVYMRQERYDQLIALEAASR